MISLIKYISDHTKMLTMEEKALETFIFYSENYWTNDFI